MVEERGRSVDIVEGSVSGVGVESNPSNPGTGCSVCDYSSGEQLVGNDDGYKGGRWKEN